MKSRDNRWLVAVVANLALIWLVGLANHHLAPFALHLYVGGLFVVFPALRLNARHGFAATIVTALAFDAVSPTPFGTHLVLLGLVHAMLLYGRQRFPRGEPVFATVVALFSNLFLFLALSFVLISANPRPAEAWLRLFVDLLASQLVVGLITPWFMALQTRAFVLVQLDPETGKRIER